MTVEPRPRRYTRRQIQAIAAFLVSRCGVAFESAGALAVEMVEACGYVPCPKDFPE